MMLNDRPTRAERYDCAAVTSDMTMRHSDFPPGAPDILAAMAWSKNRLGTELIRLCAEWDRDKPARKRARSVHQFLVLGFTREKARLEHTREKIALAETYYRQMAEAVARLHQLPAIVAQLTMQAAIWDMEDADAKAAAVVRFWLDPICKACEGRGAPLIPGTNVKAAVACSECRGKGETRPPYGEEGKRLACHLDLCKQGEEERTRRKARKPQP